MLVTPDNPKTGVRNACHYEPDLNPTYKATVENAVRVVQRWIVAAFDKPALRRSSL